MISWQLTRECDLACLHCCTDSGPGQAMPGELCREEALSLAADIAEFGVPYVMLCGGEPLLSPHFFDVAEKLGESGIQLKVETNGQRFTVESARRLAALPIRSIQVSLDGETDGAYRSLRPGASLSAAQAACRFVREAGMPLEVTFAPTRENLCEASAVIDRALALGAFRFNTGMLMRVGSAAGYWDRLVPNAEQYEEFFSMLEARSLELAGRIELCFKPRSLDEAMALQLRQPPAVLLVRPDGLVHLSASMPFVCADLRTQPLSRAWHAYIAGWERIRNMQHARSVLPSESSRAACGADPRKGDRDVLAEASASVGVLDRETGSEAVVGAVVR
jgi:MoaA/NifB/PqqE/SkfB family radical SAM enzyme